MLALIHLFIFSVCWNANSVTHTTKRVCLGERF